MNAPDKIYIFQDGDDFWYKPEEWKTPPPHRVEYLRKDALLEWAKEKYNEYKQMDKDFQGDVFIGNRHAFAEVIAKIEAL